MKYDPDCLWDSRFLPLYGFPIFNVYWKTNLAKLWREDEAFLAASFHVPMTFNMWRCLYTSVWFSSMSRFTAYDGYESIISLLKRVCVMLKHVLKAEEENLAVLVLFWCLSGVKGVFVLIGASFDELFCVRSLGF